jgi:hypothetical protein
MYSAASTSILSTTTKRSAAESAPDHAGTVDTPIWSLALGRKDANLSARELSLTQALRELIQDGHAHLVGRVLEELLSGVREEATSRGFGTNRLRRLPRSRSTEQSRPRTRHRWICDRLPHLRRRSSPGAGRFSLLTMISSATAQYFPCDSTK